MVCAMQEKSYMKSNIYGTKSTGSMFQSMLLIFMLSEFCGQTRKCLNL